MLSGVTGTRLKCEIIGEYYPLWWGITSGGPKREHSFPTAIVDLNAGTGEDYIEETQETILGSSGHALRLKVQNAHASKLKIVLVEESADCYQHLRNVIRKRWPTLLLELEDDLDSNKSGVYLLNKGLRDALGTIQKITLGNSLFFFDPLLFTPWSDIEAVASTRVKQYYHTGTEFVVFLFSSDWFLGRGELSPLPTTDLDQEWDANQRRTVEMMNEMFAHDRWRSELLTSESHGERVRKLINLYRKRLHRWFRYVLPLPFEPKAGQSYHLFMCSNYEVGVGITKRFYVKHTGNRSYSPDSDQAYFRFAASHPEKGTWGPRSKGRPSEWKVLWAVIRDHDEGLCDMACKDLRKIEPDSKVREQCLTWLLSNGYLQTLDQMTDAWSPLPTLYQLDWSVIERNLGIKPPAPLEPMRFRQDQDSFTAT